MVDSPDLKSNNNQIPGACFGQSMKKLPKAVIFDLDGTLIISSVDFMKFRKKMLEFVKTKGADMADYSLDQKIVSMISKFEAEMRRKKIPEKTIQGYLDDIDAFMNQIELERIDETVAVPGSKRLLKALRKEGVKIGILTRGCPEYAMKALKITGLIDLVDAMIARDRRLNILPKPSPESAFALLKMLDVSKDDALMLGDYSIDCICANAAGIRFFGIVSSDGSREDLDKCGCEEYVSSLNEFGKKIGL